jgi:CBS domain-containing protein
LLVKDIVERNYPSIYADELATKARAVLRERKLRILPVVDEHKLLVGVISRNDIMQITSSISPMRVKGLMTTNPYTVSPDVDVVQAMREMVRRDEWYVPVVKSPQDLSYLGILGLENYMRTSLEKNVARLSTPLSDIMSTELLTCSPNDEVDNVWQRMKEHSFAACPVVERGKAVGIVTQHNLLESGGVFPTFEAHKGRFKAPTKISSVMKTPAVSLKPTNSIKEAATLMLKRNIGRVPIVDEKGKLVGIVDREDVVKTLIK